MSHWIQTHSGRAFDYDHPDPLSVRIQDIAHALANLNRFSGHALAPYSVAQHSVLVSRHLPPSLALAGLLHDCHEAFVIDLPKPLKAMVPDYVAIEDRIQSFVLTTLGMDPSVVRSAPIKEVDLRMLSTEARDLMTKSARMWSDPLEPYPCKIIPWTWDSARQIFLRTYWALTKGKPVPTCDTCAFATTQIPSVEGK